MEIGNTVAHTAFPDLVSTEAAHTAPSGSSTAEHASSPNHPYNPAVAGLMLRGPIGDPSQPVNQLGHNMQDPKGPVLAPADPDADDHGLVGGDDSRHALAPLHDYSWGFGIRHGGQMIWY